MQGKQLSLLFFFSFSFFFFFSFLCVVGHDDSIKLELIHRHAPLLNGRPLSQLDRLKDLLRHDRARHRVIFRKLSFGSPGPRRKTWETRSRGSAIEMPIFGGRDLGIGQYLVTFRVGTPPQKFTLIADTGSELTWMNCRYRCGKKCRRNRRMKQKGVFNAVLSSSFRTVPCLSSMCKIDLSNLFSLATCPTPLSPCAYDYRYIDGSSARGIFANEKVTIGLTNRGKVVLQDVLIGCTNSFNGVKAADGVIGLANGRYSFTTKAVQQFGGKFSYCLVDHLSHLNASNYLVFGNNKHTPAISSKLRYTKLELGEISPFYGVNVVGISIGGTMLDIPTHVWDPKQGGGVVLDSGTSLTLLAEPAYRPVMAALQTSVSMYKKVELEGVPMDYCFNSTGFDERVLPSLVIHFADGARFEPHWKSYVIDAADGVKCLGFGEGNWPEISIIGNIMQQNYLWEFDMMKNTVAFAPSSCL